jgi:DNA-binding beta-propeller fold protein YncE
VRISLICLTLSLTSVVPQSPREPLKAAGVISMPAVEGRIDHLAVDASGQRLFVAALGNNTVEVIDIGGMRPLKSIAGLHEPQGICFLPDRNRVVVANGGDGSTVFYDAATLAVVHTAKTGGDADNVRYDPKTGRVYVGYGNGALAAFDPDGKPLGDVKLAAHPESFQLENSGRRIFVNVPSANHVAVVDRDRQTVTTTWPVTAAGANYPMGLDETNRRLFLGCRRPAKLLVYDTGSGKLVTAVDVAGDTDDLFYDSAKKRVYVIGGEGFITVLEQVDADHYRPIQKIPTSAGARTGLFVAELGKLFLAVPHRGAQRAEIRVYEVGA